MRQRLFEKVYQEAEKKEITDRNWIRNRVRALYKNPRELFRITENLTRIPEEDKLYLFGYDPKTKKTLPHYDTLPLTLVLEVRQTGIFGINFHYLPPILRREIISMITEARTQRRMKTITRAREVKPAFKFYLKSQIKTNFLEIDKTEWDLVSELTIEQFRKRPKTSVWGDTIGAL